METRKTERGFSLGEFTDLYGLKCSIQKSSLGSQSAIWLGVSENRMHLNREQVANLLPMLQHFVDTGELPTK